MHSEILNFASRSSSSFSYVLVLGYHCVPVLKASINFKAIVLVGYIKMQIFDWLKDVSQKYL